MTSLIDVIFLLLLFFMLSSTFSRFSEVEIAAAGSGGASALDVSPLFLRLSPDAVSVNGQPQTFETLNDAIAQEGTDQAPIPVLVSLQGGVNAQRLTDLLVTLRGVAGVQVTVLGAS